MKIGDGALKPPNPFNPGSPVDPNDFVGRILELENFRQKLRQTAGGSLASMAVAGGYGVGKTSFLHKCKAIAEGEQNALTLYFSLNEVDFLTRETLAKALIQRIQEKVREEVILNRLSSSVLSVLQRIRVKAQGIEIGLSESASSAGFPNLQTALTAAWKALGKNKSAIVFLIDEARVLEKNRAELILYLRAVLEQLQIEKTPVMIVPAGKLSITGPSGTGFSPLVRTFQPIVLENFTQGESSSFANKKLRPAGIGITTDALTKAFETSEGHPFVLTAYMAVTFEKLQASERELTLAHFKAADVEFVPRTLAPFFSRFYDQAGKTSKLILEKIAFNAGEAALAQLCVALKKESNELSPHLAKLVQDGAVIRADRGKYKLFHHLLAEYIKEKREKN